MLQQLSDLWPYLAASLNFLISLVASGHAVIYKRDTRASIAWVGAIWLVPLFGALLYVGLGINRIRRRAQALRTDQPLPERAGAAWVCTPELVRQNLGARDAHLEGLVKLVGDITARPLLHGNQILPLRNGDEAYPAMLEAIAGATHSVSLASFIFSNDRAGKPFVTALGAAVARGVAVRVLVDDVGRRYSWRSAGKALDRQGVKVARFLPTLVPWRFPYSNLRNHRKILVVDGEIGFTGGLNIREGNCLELETRRLTQDLHFRLSGPCVAHLQETFATDWAFCTAEILEGEAWFPPLAPDGTVLARGISEGPDEDFDKLRWTLLGAIACARSSVKIVNPYFLPDASIISALNVAAMRGVKVTIVLPESGNIPLMRWASTALWWQLLEHGCQIWLSSPPFDHTKLLLVDGTWTLLGSANWDARSLRLNFEFNVECYDRDLATRLAGVVEAKVAQSKQVTLQDVDGRGLPVKLRDGIARLFSPYL